MNKDTFDKLITELFKYREYNMPFIKHYRIADCYGITIDCCTNNLYYESKDDPAIWTIHLNFQFNPFYPLDPKKFFEEYLQPALSGLDVSLIPLPYGSDYVNIRIQ